MIVDEVIPGVVHPQGSFKFYSKLRMTCKARIF